MCGVCRPTHSVCNRLSGASPPSRTCGAIFIGASVYTFAWHTAIFFLRVISNFYACAAMSSWPDVRVYVYIPRYIHVCVCLIDEEAHGVFGSCRRGRGATVEATCPKATGENAVLRRLLSRGRRYCRDSELGTARE